MEKKKRKTLIWTIAAVVFAASVVCAVIGGNDGYTGKSSFFDLFDLGPVFAGKIQSDLNSFSCSDGGSMEGGCYSVTVEKWDDEHAIISYSSSDWYYQNPEVTEYLVDKQILEDIKTVFNHYGMKAWHNKKFTNEEILDGSSTSYHFSFDDESIWFSSWTYPRKYSRKLDELTEIIDKYTSPASKIPGLVVPEMTDEDKYLFSYPDDNKISLAVTEYSLGYIKYSIINGTDNDTKIEMRSLIRNADNGGVIISEDSDREYTAPVFSHSTSQGYIKLDELLDKGEYVLEVEDLSCSFVIE